MEDDLLEFEIPINNAAVIKVLGVGGGGSNAVDHMLRKGIEGVDFIVANTDNQALRKSPVPIKIQLGKTLTEGLGAGNQPDVGREAAIESLDEIKKIIGDETKMLFITAGMGGGTGTGGAPVIAQAAQEMGILTVGIVTIPFRYEGKKRIQSAIEGIKKMQENVDALLIINNEKIREIYGNLAGREALGMADEVLTTAAKGIAEIITIEGHVNVDFADVKTVMKESGVALMGTGEASGEDRAEKAIKAALSSPLLDNTDIRGAKNILLNITSGTSEITLDEIGYINDYVQDEAGNDAELIWGSSMSDSLGDKIAVTVIATGFIEHEILNLYPQGLKKTESKEISETTISEQNSIADNFDDAVNNTQGEVVKKITTVKKEDNIKRIYLEDSLEGEDEPDFEFIESSEPTINSPIGQLNSEVEYSNLENYASNIDSLTEVPAYIRKGIVVENDNYSKKQQQSRFKMKSNSDGEITINENNPYLHDKAD